jgi:hypothetical protein
VDLSTRTILSFCALTMAAFLLACAKDRSTPEPSACVQSRQRPRHFELATRCALEEAGVPPDNPAAEPHVRSVAQRFLAAGITPEDMAPEKWKVLTRPLREPSPRRAAARKRRSNATPEPASMSGMESSGITARTEKIVQQRLEVAPEEELFFAIAYGQISHEKAREPLIQRGLVREKHRDAVRSGSVAVGMSDLEVVLSQGRVADIHTVKEPSGVRRQLIYREPDSLVTTENGFVTSWKPTLPDR